MLMELGVAAFENTLSRSLNVFSLVDIYLFRENGDGLGGGTPSTLSLNWRGVGGITEFVLSSCQLPR